MRCLFALLLAASALGAQGDPQRDGLWLSVGAGPGTLGCSRCGARLSGPTGELTIGASVNDRLLAGIGFHGWVKSAGGATLTMHALTAQARLYPSADSRFFLGGGVGIASVNLGLAKYGPERCTGASALVGVGYDIRLSHGSSVTARWNGIATECDHRRADLSQVGLSLTYH